MATNNPFAPSFGTTPPVLAGRDTILEGVDDALTTGPTHPDYTTLLVGVRGAGKTSMLNAVKDLARSRGWLTLSEDTTSPDLQTRLADAAGVLLDQIKNGDLRLPGESGTTASDLQAPPDDAMDTLLGQVKDGVAQGAKGAAREVRRAAERVNREVQSAAKRIKGFSVGPFGIELDAPPETAHDLRTTLSSLGDVLKEHGVGLMITIDELQNGDPEEIREFFSVLQHITRREQRPVAFVGAALPQIKDTLLSGNTATFLQRCSLYDVAQLGPEAIRTAIVTPIEQRGAAIDPEGLQEAVAAASGYAFMVQLVGFHVWKAAADPAAGITAAEVATGIAEAEREVGRLVLDPTWRDLSDMDRRFLIAMAHDDGKSRLAKIAKRLRMDVNYTDVHRQRLIKSGMVVPAGEGLLNFAHQTTRAWLRNKPEYTTTKIRRRLSWRQRS